MIKKIIKILLWLIGLTLLILVAVVALAPFLISTQSLQSTGSAANAALAESQFIDIPYTGSDGIELHYLDLQGDKDCGQAFVALHGFTMNLSSWQTMMPYFADYGRTVAYDQIPYGLSEKLLPGDWQGPHPYTPDAAVEQLFALMTALRLDRPILVGNSSGGTLAINAALAQPERIAALILIDPWVIIRRPTFPEPIVRLPQMRRISLLLARYLGQQPKLLLWSYADPGQISTKRLELAGLHTQMQAWDLAWGELFNRSLATPIAIIDRLGEIDLPVLLIHGGVDRLVPIADSRAAAMAMPHAVLQEIPRCGHLPHEECPGAVREIIAAWMQRQYGCVRTK